MRRWIIPLLLTVGLFADWMLLSWLHQQLGFALTVLIVVAFIPWGIYLQFSQGAAVRDQLITAFTTGKDISQTAMEGAMVMIGGLMMIVPGVMSSLLGLALVLPVTRRLLSPLGVRALTMMLPTSARLGVIGATPPGGGGFPRAGGRSARVTGVATGFGTDVVDANPHGARPRGATGQPGYGQQRYGSPPQGGHAAGAPGTRQRNAGEPRKSIDAEVVRIERTDRPSPGHPDGGRSDG